MTTPTALPPLYRPVPVPGDEDAVARARDLAATGADPATLVWSERADRLDAAIVLVPDRALAEAAQVLHCGALALADALAVLIPAGVDIELRWPARVLVNAREAAHVALLSPVHASDAVPDWLVLSAHLRIAGMPDAPDGDAAPSTTMEFEQCPDVTAPAALSAFARHALAWINRWEDDGFAPIGAAWTARAYREDKSATAAHDGTTVSGRFAGLTGDGALEIDVAGRRHIVPLTGAVDR